MGKNVMLRKDMCTNELYLYATRKQPNKINTKLIARTLMVDVHRT